MRTATPNRVETSRRASDYQLAAGSLAGSWPDGDRLLAVWWPIVGQMLARIFRTNRSIVWQGLTFLWGRHLKAHWIERKCNMKKLIIVGAAMLASVGIATGPATSASAYSCRTSAGSSSRLDYAWHTIESGCYGKRPKVRHSYDPVWSNINYTTSWYFGRTPSTAELYSYNISMG